MKNSLEYRVPLNTIGNGIGHRAYGGKLEAWSFLNTDADSWFQSFRDDVEFCIRRRYLPIYRMADGEYRFLMGRKYNFRRKPLLRELIAVTAEKLHIKNPYKWKTIWGEKYDPKILPDIKINYIKNIKDISRHGYLACYINDNGLHAFVNYNSALIPFFRKNSIPFDSKNYIPFHFAVNLVVGKGYQQLIRDKNILVVTGESKNQYKITDSLHKLNAGSVHHLSISDTASMIEKIDPADIPQQIDLCLVAAGIGSANILCQLKPLNTVAIDVGGFIGFLEQKTHEIHGGFFKNFE